MIGFHPFFQSNLTANLRNCWTMVHRNQTKEAVEAIVKAIRPISVVLFGSVAREGQGNDLDLMIVIDEKKSSVSETQLTLHRCLKDFYKQYAIDPFVVTDAAVQRGYFKSSPFLRMIAREGKVLYMKDAEREWMRQAREEMSIAEYLLEGNFCKACCYHAQQAVEKAIKGRLLGKGWALEKIHNIARLMALCREYKIRISLRDEEIVFLDSIYHGRYPAEEGLLPGHEPSMEDAESALRLAHKLMRTAKKGKK